MEESSNGSARRTAATSAIRDYSHLRLRLLGCLDGLAEADQAPQHALDELRAKIESNRFNLVVVGQFKRGKTCLINALIGADILPVAVVPLTSIVTILTYGETISMAVHYADGRLEHIDPLSLADYVTESRNPKNERGVREVVIHYPSPYLEDGVRLVDTPGVGSVFIHNTDVAYEYLPKCDAALFLLSVEQPASQAELDFLKDVREHSGKIFFLLNKIDYLAEPELAESVAFSRRVLSEAMETDVKVYPVSAKLALRGKLEHSEEVLQQSRLAEFSNVLDHFLVHEKGRVLLLSASSQLQRTVAQMRLAVELELKSLSMPIEELHRRIGLIEAKGIEISNEKERMRLSLEGKLERLMQESLDPEIARFKEELLARMKVELERLFEENRELAPKDLDALLESYVTCEVEKAYRAWHMGLEEKVSEEFERRCQGLAEKTNEIIDELMRYASELFDVSFESSAAAGFWKEDSAFRFKLKEDPVGLDLVASSITGVLPGLAPRRFEWLRDFLFRRARRYVFTKRRDQMEHLIGMQAGRIRYDFVERLKKNTAGFRKELSERIETVLQSIGRAVQQGISLREAGEREAERRQEELSGHLAGLDEARGELLAIREGALSH